MFWFPLRNPLKYLPLGYCCAIVWNASELLGVPAPCAGWLFGKIIGAKGKPAMTDPNRDRRIACRGLALYLLAMSIVIGYIVYSLFL